MNHLLAALPAAEFARLSSHLELVPMPLGEMLDRTGLEARACECYSVVRTELRRLLSDVRHCRGPNREAAIM